MSILALPDCDLHYEIHGDGPPLLLVHGFFGAGVDWAPFVGAFARDHRVVVPDLRGHGRSTNPGGELTFRQCAADLLALADVLGLDRFAAIGLSGGGNAMLHVATAAPARVDAMVLVSATTHFPESARALQRAFAYEQLPADEQAAMRARHVHGEPQLAMLLRQARGFADSHDDLAFSRASLGAVGARTLVVYGDRDPFYPVEIAVDLYRGIPAAALWVLPGSGHAPIFGALRDGFIDRARVPRRRLTARRQLLVTVAMLPSPTRSNVPVAGLASARIDAA